MYKKRQLTKKQKAIKAIILIIPYMVFIARVISQSVDEFTQTKTMKLLEKWNLNDLEAIEENNFI